jgi:TPR repeat protein
MDDIGSLYEHGLGVARNRDRAIAWYRMAAAAGDEDAIEHLAALGVNARDPASTQPHLSYNQKWWMGC